MIDFIPDVKSSEEKNVIFLQLFLQIIFCRGSECPAFERAESKGQEASWQEPEVWEAMIRERIILFPALIRKLDR